ncbi:DUF1385 domain-containing protein [Priestia taiwanensis]|uniref:Membrane protein n=1 Tax=Priestia taiwanensis TaxID=1347902 RepID=A0A917ATB5_9BACI|nr:DUF1385 domain-containing protein [Priestia taiwanensis]MBM7363828.1 uncharacterized protein YqhQ [Priestia taiwanensis]GGE73802.1 membrane protein [Priestia taiwanensis]
MQERKKVYGGQAVVEGVMFGGREYTVTAIRRTDNSIEYYRLPQQESKTVRTLKKIPFIRGIVAIMTASITGSKHLNFATERYEQDPSEDEKLEENKQKESKLVTYLGLSVVAILSFLFGKVIFTLTPAIAADFLRPIFPSDFGQIVAESILKVILLLSYLYFISLTPLIKRVFQYHGAEHKVINAYENNMPLTIEHVQAQTRLHYRCGSSFIMFTVVIGMFLYAFFPTDPLWFRIVNRLLLIPVVLGLSFEFLQLTNKLRDVPVLRYLGLPGLWLQLLTTKEPTDDQVEVAIYSFKELLRLENEKAS